MYQAHIMNSTLMSREYFPASYGNNLLYQCQNVSNMADLKVGSDRSIDLSIPSNVSNTSSGSTTSIGSTSSNVSTPSNGSINIPLPVRHQAVPGTSKHLCEVCTDDASGKHYGVYSCEGCKGFFKRTVRKHCNYACKSTGNCVIDRLKRNRCQFCRYQKCIQLGMKREAVQEERPRISNKTLAQISSPQSGVSSPQSGIPSPQSGFDSPPSRFPSPHSGFPSPHRGFPSPHSGVASPYNGIASPYSGVASPYNGIASPPSGVASPYNGIASPPSGVASPYNAIPSPYSRVASPHNGIASPHNGIASPHNGIASPYNGIASPHNGISYLFSGISSPGSGIPSRSLCESSPFSNDSSYISSSLHTSVSSSDNEDVYNSADYVNLTINGLMEYQRVIGKTGATYDVSQVTEWANQIPYFSALPEEDRELMIKSACDEIMLITFVYAFMKEYQRVDVLSFFPSHLESTVLDEPLHKIYGTLAVLWSMKKLDVQEAECACLKALMLFNPNLRFLSRRRPVEHIQTRIYEILKEYTIQYAARREGTSVDVEISAEQRFTKLLLRLPSFRNTYHVFLNFYQERTIPYKPNSTPLSRLIADIFKAHSGCID